MGLGFSYKAVFQGYLKEGWFQEPFFAIDLLYKIALIVP
jgi:hypothetical protein